MRCNQCPRKCNINREGGTLGFCGVGSGFSVARAALHPWEEPPISGSLGSGTIFFSGCNLRCVFCQNYRVSHSAIGTPMSEKELIRTMLCLRDEGAHNINLVTPSHYTQQLVRVLEKVKPDLGIPVVWNSGGYESLESLRMLDGLVDIYLPDCKYLSSELSAAYSAAPDYFSVVLPALREMCRQSGRPQFGGDGMLLRGTVVRHLVLPGCRQDSIALLHTLAKSIGTDRFLLSLMCQYTPDFAQHCAHRNLHRKLTSFEYQSVLDVVAELGFEGFSQDASSATAAFTPNFSEN